MSSIVTYLIVLPLIGSALLLLVRRESVLLIKSVGIASSILTFLVSLLLYVEFDPAIPAMQFTQKVLWIPSLNVSYNVGVDGLSLLTSHSRKTRVSGGA